MINIMYSGNANIFDGILSSVVSIIYFYKQPININILTMDLHEIQSNYQPITNEMCESINNVLKKTNPLSNCVLHDLTENYKKDSNTISIAKRFTPYALLRLYSSELSDMPSKILYLDADTLAHDSIESLYNTDITNYEIAASKDYYGRVLKGRNYINSGVLLINMDKIKETKLFEKARAMCKEKRMFLADQDAINKCVTSILILDDKFNHQRRIKKDTVIRHYCTSFRVFPVIRMKKVKQYEVDKVLKDKHKVYKDEKIEAILKHFLKVKEELITPSADIV